MQLYKRFFSNNVTYIELYIGSIMGVVCVFLFRGVMLDALARNTLVITFTAYIIQCVLYV